MTTATSSALRDALGSDDVQRGCDVVDRAVGELRGRDLDDVEMIAISDALIDLAAHRKWEVRRAVALALRHVRHGAVAATLRRLKADDAARVQRAAQESLHRRAERAELDLLPYLQDERLERMLARLPDAEARKAALRVGVAYTEFMVRGLYHETIRALMPVHTSLAVLEEELRRGKIEDSTERLREVRVKLRHLREIQSAARLYATETAPQYESVSLRALFDQAIGTLRSHEIAVAHGLAVDMDVDPGLEIEGDPTSLQQVFENILKNGIEASEGLRPIPLTVKARRQRQRIHIAITDAGCGMSKEAQRELFRPYRSRKRGGTGLGMPIVMKLVQLDHGGTVDVASQPGQGTTISITLPRTQDR